MSGLSKPGADLEEVKRQTKVTATIQAHETLGVPIDGVVLNTTSEFVITLDGELISF